MHDTFLNEKILLAILKICKENSIRRLSKIIISVNEDSHISEYGLREYIEERDNVLVGEWTDIIVERQEINKLTAVIKHIEGEGPDE